MGCLADPLAFMMRRMAALFASLLSVISIYHPHPARRPDLAWTRDKRARGGWATYQEGKNVDAAPIDALQDAKFGALDVQAEEIDMLDSEVLQDPVKRADQDVVFHKGLSCVFVQLLCTAMRVSQSKGGWSSGVRLSGGAAPYGCAACAPPT
jgi:hypothetical protein